MKTNFLSIVFLALGLFIFSACSHYGHHGKQCSAHAEKRSCCEKSKEEKKQCSLKKNNQEQEAPKSE